MEEYKAEYENYLTLEKKLLQQLGIIEEDQLEM